MVSKSSTANSKEQVINLTNISKSYYSKQILSGINLVINENEVHALIGPNGAGKTTLVRIILGLINQTSGQKYIKYNDIAAMLENDYLFENKTGMQNINSFGSYFDIDKEKLLFYTKTLGLQDDLDKKVQYYSKGMKRKLTMMITIMRGTKLIIFDEPTSGVDPQSRIQIRKLFEILKGEGKTILVTSHDLAEIEKVCDRITILKSGTIVKQLTNDDTLTNLEEEFFKALE